MRRLCWASSNLLRSCAVEETFFRQLRHREFDIAEMSFSSYTLTLNSDNPPFIALPVFPSRFFRHQSIYVSKKAGIKTPADLRGKRVGCPEYRASLDLHETLCQRKRTEMTAPVWVRSWPFRPLRKLTVSQQRGIMAEHYDVPVDSVEYFTGNIEPSDEPRIEKLKLNLPPSVKVTPIPHGKCLSQVRCTLAESRSCLTPARIDAGGWRDRCTLLGDTALFIGRLRQRRSPVSEFQGGRAGCALIGKSDDLGGRPVSTEYYRQTKIMPIMHLLVIRRELHNAHPWLARSVTKAFETALNMSYEAIAERGALRYMLPWLQDHVEETKRCVWTHSPL